MHSHYQIRQCQLKSSALRPGPKPFQLGLDRDRNRALMRRDCSEWASIKCNQLGQVRKGSHNHNHSHNHTESDNNNNRNTSNGLAKKILLLAHKKRRVKRGYKLKKHKKRKQQKEARKANWKRTEQKIAGKARHSFGCGWWQLRLRGPLAAAGGRSMANINIAHTPHAAMLQTTNDHGQKCWQIS